MVQEAMVLLKGFRFGNRYKLQGSIISDGCNSSNFLDIGVEEGKNATVIGEKFMLWHQRLSLSERRVFEYYMVKVWLNLCLTTLWILIYVNIVYMGSRIG